MARIKEKHLVVKGSAASTLKLAGCTISDTLEHPIDEVENWGYDSDDVTIAITRLGDILISRGSRIPLSGTVEIDPIVELLEAKTMEEADRAMARMCQEEREIAAPIARQYCRA